jgi:hypothetical protein
MDLLVVVVVWFLLSVAAGVYAGRLNRSGLWFIVALLFSPLVAFAFLLALGAKASDRVDRVPCPFCSEPVRISAVRCPHCRSDL